MSTPPFPLAQSTPAAAASSPLDTFVTTSLSPAQVAAATATAAQAQTRLNEENRRNAEQKKAANTPATAVVANVPTRPAPPTRIAPRAPVSVVSAVTTPPVVAPAPAVVATSAVAHEAAAPGQVVQAVAEEAVQPESMDIDDHPVIIPVAAPIAPSVVPAAVVPKEFFNMPRRKKQYTDAIAQFRAHHVELRRAREELEQFKKSCNKEPPKISLPKSISLRIVSHAVLPVVENDKAFHKATTEALKKIEQDTSKQVYDALIAAKAKYIGHLQNKVNAQQYINNSVVKYKDFVHQFNRHYTEDEPSNTDFVPVKEAIAHFEDALHKAIVQYNTERVQAALEKDEEAKNNDAEEIKAQEQIREGAHNGANIESIVEKKNKELNDELEEKVKSMQQQITQLQ
jgi:hypothetical protein